MEVSLTLKLILSLKTNMFVLTRIEYYLDYLVLVLSVYLPVLLHFFIVFPFYILQDTPLSGAARNGHTDIVRLLIEKGADVNKRRGVR